MPTEDHYYKSAHKGSKDFTQQQVQTLNPTGFGATADDFAERGIDLNEHLVKNKPATFFMRVNSDAMADDGVGIGDVVIVDRSLEPKNGKIIIAVVDGELLIRKLEISGKKKRLVPASRKLTPIDVSDELNAWGVVTYVIHQVA